MLGFGMWEMWVAAVLNLEKKQRISDNIGIGKENSETEQRVQK